MNYIDTYFARVNHLGDNTADRVRNRGIRSFEKWKDESQHTVRNLSVERGIFFDGIILTNKDKEYRKIMFLNVANDIPLLIGDIMTWITDTGEEEKWLLFQEEKKVNGTYRTFWIIRCNYLLKWIDKLGHLQQSWSYLVSSVDSKIKGNFRTWNSLITPQPNKYAEILMPRYPIERATNFIVEDESWTVVEYDHTSVPGVIYLSLTEGKVNIIYDDLQNNIADTNTLAVYEIDVPAETQTFSIGSIINPTYTLMKNGLPFTAEVNLLPTDKNFAKIDTEGNLTAMQVGETDIIVQLKEFPTITTNMHIIINDNEQIFSAYIEGPDIIRLDRQAEYKLRGTTNIDNEVIFSINTDLAKIIAFENNLCTIKANDQNNLGEFVLTALYDGIEYHKTIKIIPLW